MPEVECKVERGIYVWKRERREGRDKEERSGNYLG